MLKNKEVNGKSTKNLTEIEDFYDDDFEDFDFGDEIENIVSSLAISKEVRIPRFLFLGETYDSFNERDIDSSLC